jgi:hypothetical protein
MGPGRPSVTVESTLERDFAILQRFDPEVSAVEEQPVRIEYRDVSGVRRRYVPDFLVQYYGGGRPPVLVEVKLSTDPALVAGGLEDRFAATKVYASERGWTFSVVTETAIRTPRLGNVTFLLPYRSRVPNPALRARALMALGCGCATVEALADDLAAAIGSRRDHVLPTLWSMVARFEVIADLDRPLTMRSPLHLPERGRP